MRAQRKTRPSAYARAGVDIDTMMQALQRAKTAVRATYTAGVRSEQGSFGGLFTAPGGRDLLVSSIDGVGTKLKVAHLACRHDTIGRDLVNHCVNDILVQGARPLFFMDYLGAGKLDGAVFQAVLKGLSRGCLENGCALLGGETAEMPGLYPRDEYDLVGCIVGTVPAKRLITGRRIRPGDALIGLPSNGLHTNGYSLARKILFRQARLNIDSPFPGMRRSVGDVLLKVHRSYLHPIQAVLTGGHALLGMAHITGGGLTDNMPRILPPDCMAHIRRSAWKRTRLFTALQELGKVDTEEMYRVFNMGIGMVLVVRNRHAEAVIEALAEHRQPAWLIGEIARGPRSVCYDE